MSKTDKKPWLMLCRGGFKFYLSEEEKRRYINRRTMSGKNWTIVPFEDGSEIMLEHVIAVIHNPKYVHPVEAVPVEELEIETRKIPVEPETVDNAEPEEKKESVAEKEARLLDIMIKKSNCTHEGLEVLNKQTTTKGERYFPVCSFCGHRGRYIKKENLDAKDMIEAKDYTG